MPRITNDRVLIGFSLNLAVVLIIHISTYPHYLAVPVTQSLHAWTARHGFELGYCLQKVVRLFRDIVDEMGKAQALAHGRPPRL